jgi:tRNA 2-thiouridine synthesizing protein E
MTTYDLDLGGFLADPAKWDEAFVEWMAPKVRIPNGLTKMHWEVIHFIRDGYHKTGKVPLLHETCRAKKLHLADLSRLFPTGYLRGACKLAGVTYKEGYIGYSWLSKPAEKAAPDLPEKTYQVDVRGFLVNPDEWDEQFATFKAHEMKIPEKMTDRHWQIIHFLRDQFQTNGMVPTVYETCQAHDLEIEDFQQLFPDGYHRGVVKLAGLRCR